MQANPEVLAYGKSCMEFTNRGRLQKHPTPVTCFLYIVWILMGSVALYGQQATPAPQTTPSADRAHADDSPTSDLPPLPATRVSLIRGTVARLDLVRDRLTMHVYGGRDATVVFDPRTQFLHGESHIKPESLKPGMRLSVDTVGTQDHPFAKTVRLETQPGSGEVTGQVVSYEPATETLTLQANLYLTHIRLRVPRTATVVDHGATVTAARIAPGMLVHVSFAGESRADAVASQIDILATPGSQFTFAGTVASVDLRAGLVAIADTTDSKIHEVTIDRLDPATVRRLREGVEVTIQAEFDGTRYVARSATIVARHE